MARFYANENFPAPVVVELRRLGHDVLTSHDAGKSNQRITDDLVLAFASAEQRILLTLNRRDFIQLHRDAPHHAGIVACTVDPDLKGQANRIHSAVHQQSEMVGVLLRVNRPAI